MGDVSIYMKLNWNGDSVVQLPWVCHPLWGATSQRWSSLGVFYDPVSNPSTRIFKLQKLIGLPRWTWVESLLWAVISVLSEVKRHLYTSLPRTVNTAPKSHGCFWELQATQPPPTSSKPGRVPQVREEASSMLSGSSPFFLWHIIWFVQNTCFITWERKTLAELLELWRRSPAVSKGFWTQLLLRFYNPELWKPLRVLFPV